MMMFNEIRLFSFYRPVVLIDRSLYLDLMPRAITIGARQQLAL